jgi:hypothetical protein
MDKLAQFAEHGPLGLLSSVGFEIIKVRRIGSLISNFYSCFGDAFQGSPNSYLEIITSWIGVSRKIG